MGKRSDVRVTTRSVIAAQPGSVTWDAEVKGFGVRVAPSGGRFYVLKYRVGSRQRWFTIGRHGSPWTAEQARDRAKGLLAQVMEGDDPSAKRERERGNPTVAELARQFMAEHVLPKAKPRTAVEYGRVIDRFIVREFGRKRVMDVKAEDIAKLHHSLRMTPRQANVTVNVGRKMFGMAELWGYRPPGSNPCSHIERYREVRRERFLSHEEIAQLGEALARCEHGWTKKNL